LPFLVRSLIGVTVELNQNPVKRIFGFSDFRDVLTKILE
jgi:hypothetical protein